MQILRLQGSLDPMDASIGKIGAPTDHSLTFEIVKDSGHVARSDPEVPRDLALRRALLAHREVERDVMEGGEGGRFGRAFSRAERASGDSAEKPERLVGGFLAVARGSAHRQNQGTGRGYR